ncbi:hypothetical protein QFC21_001570 [Naganishia friedmannii]|uniref:Uncharacterized protein n=1 Tax=Naganishia friedmannii TaxID=89922 RepID=A0ACC2W5F0_9TREE|nr:hypothetical protein QFC21_001570 [Naganishia friedmannii]
MSATAGRHHDQKPSTIVDDLAHSPSAIISGLHAQLFALYSPLKWRDFNYSQKYGREWHTAHEEGKAVLNGERYKQAIRYFSRAAGHVYKIEFADSSERSVILSGILKRRAFALYKIGRYENALSDINIAIRLITRIKEPDMHLLVTDIQLAMKKYDDAQKSCQEAFKISLKVRAAPKAGLTDIEREIAHNIKQLVGKEEEYKGVRLDPVQHLSMDILELVMQHGLAGDNYFA